MAGRLLVTIVLTFLLQSKVHARSLIVSDIDDTIKVSHVLDLQDKVYNSVDVTTPFSGMSQLFHLLVNQNSKDTQMVYLSNAPENLAGIPLLAISHQTFLNFNNFPPGELSLREDIFDKNHKINELRRIITEQQPNLIILFGDNGERDAEIYHQTFLEFGDKIKIITFIHQLYASTKPFYIPNFIAEVGKKIFPEQVGYVTPIEISIELKRLGLLSPASYDWMIKNISPYILNESYWKLNKLKPMSFPLFKNCSDFVWRWKLTSETKPLFDKILRMCAD